MSLRGCPNRYYDQFPWCGLVIYSTGYSIITITPDASPAYAGYYANSSTATLMLAAVHLMQEP
jgi:hypothetical protein